MNDFPSKPCDCILEGKSIHEGYTTYQWNIVACFSIYISASNDWRKMAKVWSLEYPQTGKASLAISGWVFSILDICLPFLLKFGQGRTQGLLNPKIFHWIVLFMALSMNIMENMNFIGVISISCIYWWWHLHIKTLENCGKRWKTPVDR